MNGYQLSDNFSVVKPKHSLKFGFGHYQSRMLQRFIANAPITYSFTGRFSGHSVADFLLGIGESTTTFLYGGTSHLYNSQYHIYGQDQWQVTPSLTINYGLRWEIHTPWREIRGQNAGFNPRTGAMIITEDADIGNFATAANVPVERIDKKSLYDTAFCCLGPLMPRFGFAWQLARTTVLRGGYAVSLNTEIGNLLNSPLAPPYWIRTGISEQVYPGLGFNTRRATLNDLAANPVDLQPLLPGFQEGYVQSWSLTLEKQLGDGTLLSSGYVGSKGTRLSTLGSVNEAPPGPGTIQPRRPFPRFGNFTTFENYGDTNYHSLQVKAERRFGAGLGFLSGYTWAKALGNTSTLNEGTRALSMLDRNSARGRVGFDIRHRATAAVIYEFPFGPQSRLSAGSNAIIGGWQLNTITAFQTGYPINLSVSPCLINGASQRCVPNLNGEDHGALPRGDRNINRWFNTSVFSAPAQFQQGNMQQWVLDGPTGLNNWDTSFVKNTMLREGMNLQFRAEFFNLFNHTRFNSVSTALGAATFGQVTSSTGNGKCSLPSSCFFRPQRQ